MNFDEAFIRLLGNEGAYANDPRDPGGERHEYSWVLRDRTFGLARGTAARLDPNSRDGRKVIALFHSDATGTIGGSAPRWFRKMSDHRIRTVNDRTLRRWIADPGFDPVFQDWHKHEANWNWW